MTMTITIGATAPRSDDWKLRGSCGGMDPDIFFPVLVSGPSTSGSAGRRVAAAKRICYACPVISECLTWALRHGEEWGVWGGLSEHERRRLLARGI
jgi:WhiB family transcriptional regulator, redox-sensing transcriptional regulator